MSRRTRPGPPGWASAQIMGATGDGDGCPGGGPEVGASTTVTTRRPWPTASVMRSQRAAASAGSRQGTCRVAAVVRCPQPGPVGGGRGDHGDGEVLGPAEGHQLGQQEPGGALGGGHRAGQGQLADPVEPGDDGNVGVEGVAGDDGGGQGGEAGELARGGRRWPARRAGCRSPGSRPGSRRPRAPRNGAGLCRGGPARASRASAPAGARGRCARSRACCSSTSPWPG